jgi:hypothetical protein
MGEEKEILLRGKVCAYLTCRLMGDPRRNLEFKEPVRDDETKSKKVWK